MSSPTSPSDIVAIPSGYLASIFADGIVVTNPVIRTSATFYGLATATDFVVPGLSGADGGALAVGYAPFGAGSKCYIVGDNDGNIVSSVDLSTWVAGSFPVGQVLIGHPVFVYDDVHHVFIGMTFGANAFGNVVTATPGAGPLTWADRGGIPGVTNSIGTLGYRPGSGVTLAISLYGQLNKSTDGGVTWTSLGILAPSGGAPWYLAYGQGAWVAVFDNSFVGTRDVYRSTDNGTTWTFIVDLVTLGMEAVTGNRSVLGTDNAGHWVCFNDPPDASAINYAVSSNDGLTWSVPGITSNGGFGTFSIIFESSTVVKAVLFDAATQSFAFAATSIDGGNTWMYGHEFLEPSSSLPTGPPIFGKLTKKLLLWLHRIFDKDPHQKLAFRLQYDGGMAWTIKDGVLSTVVTGGTGANLSIGITGTTIAQLADYLATQTGYSVPYQDSSRYADLSALALLDGTNNIATSNGDHIYGYTSLLWAYLEANGAELAIAEFQISKALQQMNTTTAQDEWLDYQGSFYNAPRKQGELDPNYSPRIIAGVLQPRGNNVAIASAIESIALGAQTVRVIDSIDNVGFSITYNGEIHFDGSSFYDAGLGPSGAYGFFDVDFSFDFGGSITQGTYFSQITSTVEEFRDGGTQLRTVIFRNNGSTATIISDTFVGNVRVIVYDDFTGLNFRVLESGLIRLTEAGDARLLES